MCLKNDTYRATVRSAPILKEQFNRECGLEIGTFTFKIERESGKATMWLVATSKKRDSFTIFQIAIKSDQKLEIE